MSDELEQPTTRDFRWNAEQSKSFGELRAEMPDQEALTIKEAARRLKVHPNTIRNRIRSGHYPNAYQDDERGRWRIPVEDLEAATVATAEARERPDPATQASATQVFALQVLKQWETLQGDLRDAWLRAEEAATRAANAEGRNEWLRAEVERLRGEVERVAAVLSKRQRRRLEQ